jgi:hypothetical protein
MDIQYLKMEPTICGCHTCHLFFGIAACNRWKVKKIKSQAQFFRQVMRNHYHSKHSDDNHMGNTIRPDWRPAFSAAIPKKAAAFSEWLPELSSQAICDIWP